MMLVIVIVTSDDWDIFNVQTTITIRPILLERDNC